MQILNISNWYRSIILTSRDACSGNMKRMDLQKNANFYRLTISDIILILLILLFTIGTVLFAGQNLHSPLSNNQRISIFQNGKILKQLKLNKDREISLLNGKMKIEISGNKLRVKESNCNRQTCVHMGWISYPGETIACLPNGILIEIDPSDSSVVDAVIYWCSKGKCNERLSK